MRQEDSERFGLCLLACSEMYGREVGEAAAGVWWKVLEQYDIEAVEAAFSIHLADPDSGQFMPKPADIVRRMSGTTQDAALRAWAQVDRALRQVGPWQSVVFDDPVTMAVLRDMGGWTALSEKSDDEWPFVAREFENRYRGYKQRGETPEHPRRLVGFAEAGNMREGRAIAPPVLIGDPARAAHVLAAGTDKPALSIVRNPAEILRLTAPDVPRETDDAMRDEGSAA